MSQSVPMLFGVVRLCVGSLCSAFQALVLCQLILDIFDRCNGLLSNEVSPEHSYAQDGIYEVCLTVSNENGSHTACDTLYLGIVNSSNELTLDIQPQVFQIHSRGNLQWYSMIIIQKMRN